MSNEQQELNWQAHPLKELLRLTWPIAVSTLSYSIMTLVDTLLVGHLGPAALAGVGLGGTAAFALLCFSIGLIGGGVSMFAAPPTPESSKLAAVYATLCSFHSSITA